MKKQQQSVLPWELPKRKKSRVLEDRRQLAYARGGFKIVNLGA